MVTVHTIGTEVEYLWDVDEADRFAKLTEHYGRAKSMNVSSRC